ncbi:MAG: MBL fold metallo-hydrolase [Acidobacteria bacterium]|nr:MAG: MBL fold metallo-hydrolase [Acidobacteriota bacterium]REJ99246.1 MAG: MBL fold metallo-hydrolase [Acidobacteriota bacterium]REK16033.1 MAG: MBL fold metallo-hydrolase [Acidobacteriota bacterium]REK43714.1 MAG: MBL fold metallo-hydrolase [Acidobacteriota bacterium]
MKAINLIAIILFTIAGISCASNSETSAQTNLEELQFAKGDVNVTYLGNEGVLIAVKEKKVLIDGLHRKYLEEYAYPPDDLREKIEQAKGEFSGIDLVLVSHIHGDHFHPESVGKLLMNERHVMLVSSPQVVESMESGFADFEKIKGKVNAVDFEIGKESDLPMGIFVRYLGLSHGSGRHASIQNLGHVVQVGSINFLHLGDADTSEENFEPFDLEKANIDVAFIPFWYLLDAKGREMVDRQFNPKRIIAVHVDVNEAERIKKDLQAADPRIRVFTEILETATF